MLQPLNKVAIIIGVEPNHIAIFSRNKEEASTPLGHRSIDRASDIPVSIQWVMSSILVLRNETKPHTCNLSLLA